MTHEDINALLDEVMGKDEAPGPAFEQAPPSKPPTTPKAKAGPKKLPRKRAGSATEAAKQGAKSTTEAIDEALSGLYQLLGGGKARLGAGLTFDEETYAAAKPAFARAWDQAKEAALSFADFVKYVTEKFGTALRHPVRPLSQPGELRESDGVSESQAVHSGSGLFRDFGTSSRG